jgi:flagellar biogenesis protein FliO
MEAVNQVAAVLSVLGLLTVVVWWLRRRGVRPGFTRRAPVRLIENLERVPLGPQQTLHLVRVGERVLLVACYPSGCAVLERMHVRALVPSGEAVQ